MVGQGTIALVILAAGLVAVPGTIYFVRKSLGVRIIGLTATSLLSFWVGLFVYRTLIGGPS